MSRLCDAVASIVLLATFGTAWALGTPGPAEDPCARYLQRIQPHWDVTNKRQISASLTKAELQANWPTLELQLAAFTKDWLATASNWAASRMPRLQS